MSSLSTSENACDTCTPLDCNALTADQLFCKFSNAVVRVQSKFILLGSGVVTSPTPGVPPVGGSQTLTSATPLSDPTVPIPGSSLPSGGRHDVVLVGNGFFIRGHYIVCPASLVLLPPAMTAYAVRYPLVNPATAVDPNGTVTGQMVQPSEIIVDVFNVNTKGRELHDALSYSYKATLVGVDGAADIAVLRIDMDDCYNANNPCINDCHPVLHFSEKASAGCRTPMARGQKAYLLGDYLQALNRTYGAEMVPNHPTRLSMGITEGLIAHHRHMNHPQFALQELVVVSGANIGTSAVGLPILNSQGHVLGMQTLNPTSIQENSGVLKTPDTVVVPAQTITLPATLVLGVGSILPGVVGGTAAIPSSPVTLTANSAGQFVIPANFFGSGLPAAPITLTPVNGNVTIAAGSIGTGIPLADVTLPVTPGSTITIPASTVTAPLDDSAYMYELNPAECSGPGVLDLIRVIKLLTRKDCTRTCNAACDPLEEIDDSIGSYVRVVKGYAGIASDLFIGAMYDYTVDYSGDAGTAGDFGGLPRVILDDAGNFPCGATNKQVVGVRVLAVGDNGTLPSANGTYHIGDFPDGGIPVPSPFVNKIKVGSVIYAIEGKFLGDVAEQIVPTLVTWIANQQRVTLEYRTTDSAPNDGITAVVSPIYENKNKALASLGPMPQYVDYPFYATSLWTNDLATFSQAYAPNMDSTLFLPQVRLEALPVTSRFHPSW